MRKIQQPAAPSNGTAPPVKSEFKPVSVQIPIPLPEDPPFRLTKEIRAELVATTGHDIAEDDPALALVVLCGIFLRTETDRIAHRISKANEEAAAQLEKLRATTIDRTSTALVEMANAKIAEANASIRAAQTKQDQSIDLGLHQRTYLALGLACGLLLLIGFILGLSFNKPHREGPPQQIGFVRGVSLHRG